jgi:hypothetical protein
LGVDRDDVVGALDAFVNGGERTDPGVQQPLPARAGGGLWDPSQDRRWPARDHGGICANRSRPAQAPGAAPVARVVGSRVRGRLRLSRRRWHRRRGPDARPTAALPDQTWCPAGADCASTPGSLALGRNPQQPVGVHPHAREHRRRT